MTNVKASISGQRNVSSLSLMTSYQDEFLLLLIVKLTSGPMRRSDLDIPGSQIIILYKSSSKTENVKSLINKIRSVWKERF